MPDETREVTQLMFDLATFGSYIEMKDGQPSLVNWKNVPAVLLEKVKASKAAIIDYLDPKWDLPFSAMSTDYLKECMVELHDAIRKGIEEGYSGDTTRRAMVRVVRLSALHGDFHYVKERISSETILQALMEMVDERVEELRKRASAGEEIEDLFLSRAEVAITKAHLDMPKRRVA